MQGINLKRILATGPYCTSAPVSPLCRYPGRVCTLFVWKKKEELSLKGNRAKKGI